MLVLTWSGGSIGYPCYPLVVSFTQREGSEEIVGVCFEAWWDKMSEQAAEDQAGGGPRVGGLLRVAGGEGTAMRTTSGRTECWEKETTVLYDFGL